MFVDRIFNRKPMLFDKNDFRMERYITPAMNCRVMQITKNEWPVARILDQETSGHCEGFSWTGFGICLPIFRDWGNQMGHDMYYAAKEIDGHPGAEDGSDTRSGVKAFQRFGRLDSYAFAYSLQDIITWLLLKGPVVTGTNWYSGMNKPDSNGLIKVSGSNIGGHAYYYSGVDTESRLLKITNSWDCVWAKGGQAYIGFDDAERLLNENGDACVAIEAEGEPIPEPIPVPPEGCASNLKRIFLGV